MGLFFRAGSVPEITKIPKILRIGKRDGLDPPKLPKVMARTPQSLEKGVLLETILGAFGSTHYKQHAFKNSVENRGAALQTSHNLDKYKRHGGGLCAQRTGYIYIYIYIHIHIQIHIYIYIERERERYVTGN